MNYEIGDVTEEGKEALAGLRITAMKGSLENIGRFDPVRVRDRFISVFSPEDTRKIIVGGKLVGFYALKNKEDHYYLDHLYFLPQYQGFGLGSKIISSIKEISSENGIPVRLRALRKSRSNDFYLKHGFKYTHEEEWDIYYEFKHD